MATPAKCFTLASHQLPAKRLVELTYECMKQGIKLIRPGICLGDIGYAIQSLAENNNCAVVREYCGHGIGKEFHEDPQILHYGSPNTGIKLEAGMTITIEPMINLGKRDVKLLSDDWTVVTA